MRWRAVMGATAQRRQRAFARLLPNRWDKAAAAKAAADKAAADKAAADKAAADKAAAEKAAAEKAAAEKVAAEKVAAEKRAAAERAAAERAAAEKVAAEKRAADKATAEKAAVERAAAERAAADKAAAEELRRRATALGLLQVLTTANIADDVTLKKTIAFCDEQGVTSVSDLVEYNLVDDFVRHLGLRNVPGMKLRGMLQPPTSGLAGHLSNRLVPPSNSSSNKPSPETAPTERAAEPSFWPWGQPGTLIATDDLPCMQVLTTARVSLWGQAGQRNQGNPWDFRSLLGLPAAENKARLALEEDGFALRALLPGTDARLLRSLEALLQTERPEWLGKGKDVVSKKYGPYDSLKLACAWKVDHPRNRSKYTAGVERVQQELELLEKKGKNVSFVPGLPVKTDRVRGFILSPRPSQAPRMQALTTAPALSASPFTGARLQPLGGLQ